MSVSQEPFFLDPHLHMAQGENDSPTTESKPSPSPETPAQPSVNLLVSSKQPTSTPASLNTPRSPSPAHPSITATDPNASIQSILTASKKEPPASGQPWTPTPPLLHNHESDALVTPQSAAGKRKLDEPSPEDPHTKIRRIVRDHVTHDPTRVMPMTTVICLHAAVAQKSYGTEKRFLCPPPVVHIEGPVWHLRSQQLSMAVVSESGERSFEQKAPLDNNMTASFKFLHVTGTAKAKSFQLSLDIAEPPPPSLTPDGADVPSGRVWASFDSAPVTIISKPSKKTAKTRNISSCILAGGPVSLFNRINSQTVRTKYMTIDHAQLCASNVAWSAFNVNVVSRPSEAPPVGAGGPQPVTYGCEIVLSDTHSGISTSPLIIRKVDKGKVSADDGGPVSQMQKIALQRVNPDGSRHYLSAAGPLPGTPGVVTPPAPGMSSQAGTHPLLFQSPRVRDELKDGVRVISDEVDDYLCWTIVGISKFQYTFFDAFGQNNTIPAMPITPFPTLFTAPVYRPNNNTVELTVSNFFYEDPKTRTQTPLDVYLGNLGPLRHRIYQATPPGPLTNISPFVQSIPGAHQDGGPSDAAGTPSPTIGPPRYMAPGPLHTIVIVEMPPLAEVIKALEQDALPPSTEGVEVNHASPRPADGAPTPDARSGPSQPQPPPPPPPPLSIAGRSLPLLFIRAADGVGYHSGRTIACENVFQSIDLGNMAANPAVPANIDTGWLAAAQAAAAAEGGMHGWTLRVM
ncbi:putative LAG1, DNA binding [Lyophyllum shimeji]|uniref:LAG1, DNA binding n=1 Tax=Lyophyllum shimeji TaxID=47721 RepID=A0A9P3PHA0_LYOSH|nr:putative LAG1, DNA binding [Lyophyllum shimeji]